MFFKGNQTTSFLRGVKFSFFKPTPKQQGWNSLQFSPQSRLSNFKSFSTFSPSWILNSKTILGGKTGNSLSLLNSTPALLLPSSFQPLSKSAFTRNYYTSEKDFVFEPPVITFPLKNDNPYVYKPSKPPVHVGRNKRVKAVPEPRFGITKDIFLYKIGKDSYEQKDKFESWEKLFSLSSYEMKKLGVPIPQRKWILNWTEKYRAGIEPYSIRLKSRSVKHKSKRLELKRMHVIPLQTIIKARKNKKQQEKRKAKQILKSSTTSSSSLSPDQQQEASSSS